MKNESNMISVNESQIENPKYLKEQIITYIGNKRSLLNFIEEGVLEVKKRTGKKTLSTLDLFSGSGIVSRFLKQHSSTLITNDFEKYSAIINNCFLSNKSAVDFKELEYYLKLLNNNIIINWKEGFITKLYSPKDESCITHDDRVFYTKRNAIYLDTARQAIAELPGHIQKYFLAPLLSSASVHVNTSGVFKGFYKNTNGIGTYGGSGKNALSRILGDISIELPILSNFECEYKVYQEDSNELVRSLHDVDFAYIDPPYNQHPYGSNYFMLNLLTDYIPPTKISNVSGIPVDWKRSSYNKKSEAQESLFHLVEHCPAKFILISYNSEGFISYDSFMNELMRLGKVTSLETSYNTFKGCRNLKERSLMVTEYLFLIEKY